MKRNMDKQRSPSSAEGRRSPIQEIPTCNKLSDVPVLQGNMEEYFDTLLREILDGVLITDTHGRVLRVNQSFLSMGRYHWEISPGCHACSPYTM